MRLRGGKESKYMPIKTRGFNVRGRADIPEPTNILISNSPEVQKLGRSHGVGVLSAGLNDKLEAITPTLVNSYAYQQQLAGIVGKLVKRKSPDPQFWGQYLLLGYGEDYLYYAQAPLDLRGPRPNPAKPKNNASYVDAPDVDRIDIEVTYTSPCTKGSESPGRDSVMGGSALNYVKEIYDAGWADERKWEWLHILGHALGGDNEKDNLVAGTFDGNTQMIPYERKVAEMSQQASAANPVTVQYMVDLYPDTRIAMDIQMNIKAGSYSSGWVLFRTLSNLVFDKLQYDLWCHAS